MSSSSSWEEEEGVAVVVVVVVICFVRAAAATDPDDVVGGVSLFADRPRAIVVIVDPFGDEGGHHLANAVDVDPSTPFVSLLVD
jgi:hypothetical protein